MATFKELKQVSGEFNKKMSEWIRDNSLTELLDYKHLNNKDRIGKNYRHDQWYYEYVSNLKSKLIGIKSLLMKMKDKSNRVELNDINKYSDYIDNRIKELESLIFTSRQRISFYQDMIKLISNFTYGEY